MNTSPDLADGFSANAWHYSTYVSDRSPVPGPGKNYLSRYVIPWQRQTATLAQVPTFAQCLWHARAAGAFLGCAVGILADKLTTSVRSFVVSEREALRPADIVNTLRQHASGHALNIQVFHGDQTEAVYPIAGDLVVKVRSLITNSDVGSLEDDDRFPPPLAAFLAPCHAALGDPKFSLRLSVVPGIVHGRSIGKRGKVSQSDIYANSGISSWQRLCFSLDTKANEPAICLPFQGNGFDRSLDWAVQLDLDVTSALNAQLAAVEQSASVPVGRECDRVETAIRAEAWKAGFIASFHTGEESLEGFVQPAKNVLAAGEVCQRQTAIGPHRFQLVRLVVVVDRLTACLPRPNALLKSSVIEGARLAQFAVQEFGLGFGRIQAVLEGKAHLAALLSFDVLARVFGVSLAHDVKYLLGIYLTQGGAVLGTANLFRCLLWLAVPNVYSMAKGIAEDHITP